MIKTFVDRFQNHRAEIEEKLKVKHPEDYAALVKIVVEVIGGDYNDGPDPERIHAINDGDYQGTLVFVIAEKGYQPTDYWYVRVSYGSCSGCDTLEAIRSYLDGPPTEKQIKDYMTLVLHIVQGIKKMDEVLDG